MALGHLGLNGAGWTEAQLLSFLDFSDTARAKCTNTSNRTAGDKSLFLPIQVPFAAFVTRLREMSEWPE